MQKGDLLIMYTCPVCGYYGLRHPPQDYTICPSCGTEFGYTDFAAEHAELRRRWRASGMQWHSRVVPRPPNWNPIEQFSRVATVLIVSASLTTDSRDAWRERRLEQLVPEYIIKNLHPSAVSGAADR